MDRASGLAAPVSRPWQSRGTARTRERSRRAIWRTAPLASTTHRSKPRRARKLGGAGVSPAANLEAEPAEIPYNAVERTLRHAGPALLMLRGPDGASSLALAETRRRVAVVLAPDGRRHRVPMSEIPARLRQEVDAPLAPMVQTLLVEAGIPAARRPRARLAILHDQIGSAPISPCWLLRLRPDAPFWRHVRQALLTRRLLVFPARTWQVLCVGAAWSIVGGAALEGRFDAGTLVAWTFLLLMLVPLALIAAWSQSMVAIGAGGTAQLRACFTLATGTGQTRHDGSASTLRASSNRNRSNR